MSDIAGSEQLSAPSREATRAAMRLGAERPPVTRLSRRVLAGLGALAVVGLGAVLAYALVSRDGDRNGQELVAPAPAAPPDQLSALPRDYAGIPKLGPPLPGDLGRPMLRSQGASEPAVSMEDATAALERQRELETEAARTSRLFADVDVLSATAGPNSFTGSVVSPLIVPDISAEGAPAQSSAQQRQRAFLDADIDRRVVAPDRVAAPASPYILQAGSVIPAALITGIRSDLPGQITAQVTQNVYDSPTGRILLIPQGARIIGEYDNDVGFGQSRILLVWNRLIFPDGRSIVLERQPGADAGGYAGVEDGVDHHWLGLAAAAGLSTLLNVGAELATDDSDTLLSALRDGLQGTVGDAAQQIVRQQLGVPPTLTVQPGFEVRVMVTRDLVLEPMGD